MAISASLGSSVFLDSAYIIALSTPKDKFHNVAVELSAMIAARPPQIVTSRGILLEIGNSLSKLRYRTTAVNILSALNNDSRIEIVDVIRQALAGIAIYNNPIRSDEHSPYT